MMKFTTKKLELENDEKLTINKSLLIDLIKYNNYDICFNVNNKNMSISTTRIFEKINELILNNIEDLEFFVEDEKYKSCFCHINKVIIVNDLK